MSNSEQRDGLFIVGFLFGAIVGAVLAGFYAPQSGETTREQIREHGLELKGRADDAVMRAQTIANETLARVQSSVRGNSGSPGSAG